MKFDAAQKQHIDALIEGRVLRERRRHEQDVTRAGQRAGRA
jgi:hypothetical protein